MATKTSGGTRIGANVRCKRGRKRWDMRLRFGPGDWRWLSTGMTTQRAAEAVREVEQTRIERGEAGLLDPFDATRATPLADLVATYCQVLQALNRAPRHVASVRDRLSFAFDAMGARFVQDADLPKIEAFLGKVVRGEGLPPMRARSAKGKPIPRRPVSLRTRDGYVEVLRAFGNWMHEGGRWGSNPFGKVRTEASGSPPTMEHRAFDVDEIDALVGAAEVRCVQQWVRGGKDGGGHANADATKLAALAAEGWARGTLYLFASYAALRWNECRTLCWGDLVLDGPEPYVLVRAKNAKNRKTGQQVPLVDFLVERLQQHRKRQAEAAVRGGGRVPARDCARMPVGRNSANTTRTADAPRSTGSARPATRCCGARASPWLSLFSSCDTPTRS